ncbi:MAG: hypothetical protein ACFFDT_22925, partial [Candidatus Hodarchaeota archaeon]
MTQIKNRWAIILCVMTSFGIVVGLSPISADAYPFYSIPEIQGDGWDTPREWQYLQTKGIVTADYQSEEKSGFFLQDPIGDNDPDTSDGIYVYEPSYKTWWGDTVFEVNVGDEIELVGRAREYYGLTEIDRVSSVTILSTDNSLPEPVELNPPSNDYASDVYYEALEGMLVSVSEMKAVAGTNYYGEAAGVVADLNVDHAFRDDPAGTGEIIFTDDAGGYVLNLRTGNIVKGLVGPLDYNYDEYKILPARDADLKIIPKGSGNGLGRGRAETQGLSIATYNMYNLFEEGYGDLEVKLAKHALTIREYLREPDLIAVQEVEKLELLEQLVATPPIEADYGVVLIDGPDSRGIDVGLLYRTDRVTILSAEARQTCTTLDDGYGPGEDPNFPCPAG